jgi:hypothetical protein
LFTNCFSFHGATMPLQTFQITAEIPEGYEPTGEFRGVSKGEHYITMLGDVLLSTGDDPRSELPRVILRPVWQWPEFIKPGTWFAYHSNFTFSLFSDQPKEARDCWCRQNGIGTEVYLTEQEAALIGFPLPPRGDWRQSLRQKPEGK